jgi:hypothetical protein
MEVAEAAQISVLDAASIKSHSAASTTVMTKASAKTPVTVSGTLGYYLLDGYGGIHDLGEVHSLVSKYFGYDIARDLVPTRSGEGYYILDGFGGIHGVGDAEIPQEGVMPVFGADLAKRLAVTPNGLYMMDAMGLVYASSDNDKFKEQVVLTEPNAKSLQVVLANIEVFKVKESKSDAQSSDIIRMVRGYYVMDGYGKVYAVGDVPVYDGPLFTEDIARDMVLSPNGKGYYILDCYGNIYVCGEAPELPEMDAGRLFEEDTARRLLVSDTGFAILDSWGRVYVKGEFPKPQDSPGMGMSIAKDIDPYVETLFGRLETIEFGELEQYHDFMNNEKRCMWCHTQEQTGTLPEKSESYQGKFVEAFRYDQNEMCIACHGKRENEHPIMVKPHEQIPADLSLDDEGRISCLTCHRAHAPLTSNRNWVPISLTDKMLGNERTNHTFYLRRNNADGDLCLICHERFER